MYFCKSLGTLALIWFFLFVSFSRLYGQEAKVPQEFSNLWVPGFSSGVLYLFSSQEYFWGGTLRFNILYGLDRGRPRASFMDRGRYEVYVEVGLYVPAHADTAPSGMCFVYTVGCNTAIETPRKLHRDFLIPYIGLEVGGLALQEQGNGFLAMPIMGLNIISRPSASFSLESALFLNTLALEDYLSIRVKMNLNFVF